MLEVAMQAAVLEAHARRQADLQESEAAAAEVVDVVAGKARAAVLRADQLRKAAERRAVAIYTLTGSPSRDDMV